MIARTCLLIGALVAWGPPRIPGLAPAPDYRVPSARASEAAWRLAPIPSGTSVPVTVDEDIPIKKENFGQTFPAHVTRDVIVDGRVVIPQGAPAEVKLTPSDEKANAATLKLSQLEVDGKMQAVTSSSARAESEKQ